MGRRKSPSCRPGCCSRTSPACRASSISRRCATASLALGGRPEQVNPLQAVELVIDHSVQVDHFGTATALQLNADLEYQRNRERYVFLRWGQTAFRNFRVVPPETGIVHQVNIEYLARVVYRDASSGDAVAYPDTVFGTDSHTTMVNGLGVVGWGVGGIEAEAAMLGQPSSMLIPPVLGCRLSGPAAERLHRHRSRPHDHRSASQARRGRQVRRVLRPGPRAPDDRGSRDARQHVPGVRRHRRDLPDRRDDARLPAPDRPRRRAHRAGRGVRQSAGFVQNRRDARCDLQRDDGTRSRDGRTEPGGPAAAAGSRAARQGQELVCDGVAGSEKGRQDHVGRRRGRRDRNRRSNTGRSSSRRSRAAPTPRTRAS